MAFLATCIYVYYSSTYEIISAVITLANYVLYIVI